MSEPSKTCGRQPLKNLKGYMVCYPLKFSKGCLPQILLGPFLNTSSHIGLTNEDRDHGRVITMSCFNSVNFFHRLLIFILLLQLVLTDVGVCHFSCGNLTPCNIVK